MNEPIAAPNWTRRRNFMYLVALFCVAVICYVLGKQLESEVAETAVMFSFLTLIGIVGSYVFGAAWDDKNLMNMRGK